MTHPAHIAVIDIGKTHAKLALVDAAGMAEIAVTSRDNIVLAGPPYPHFDLAALWQFIQDGLRQMQAAHGIDAISITTHGAAAVLLDAQGGLAAPMLDYEHDGPGTLADAYNALRPDFMQTGAPRLALGLNLGAQLHWLFHRDPDLLGRTAQVVTYPQYWGYLLTGKTACDPCSLGCHTDLWNPATNAPSDLVAKLGLTEKLAPLRAPFDVLGQVLPDLARDLGLGPNLPVYVGIHDSNASLLPHVLSREPPFGVVSTGTWVIAMAMGGAPVALAPARDTLININALGAPVPSARFMGGREYEMLASPAMPAPTDSDVAGILADGVALLPAVVPSAGPFQGHKARWIGPYQPAPGTADYSAAVAIYLAMMTATCLELIGQNGSIIIEGPFGQNKVFLQMLACVTQRKILIAPSQTGTSVGAALLAVTTPPHMAKLTTIHPPNWARTAEYAAMWRKAAAENR